LIEEVGRWRSALSRGEGLEKALEGQVRWCDGRCVMMMVMIMITMASAENVVQLGGNAMAM
jgi:hypothetical protein